LDFRQSSRGSTPSGNSRLLGALKIKQQSPKKAANSKATGAFRLQQDRLHTTVDCVACAARLWILRPTASLPVRGELELIYGTEFALNTE